MRRPRDEPGRLFKSGLLPMVDVGFLLLIAFMASIRFVGLEAKLSAHLPSGHHFG